jgi:hypothetical protein
MEVSMATVEDFFPSRFLKAADLGGKERLVTIDRVESEVFEQDNNRRPKPVVHFKESGIKPMVANKTNYIMLAAVCGKDDKDWPGKQIILYPQLVPFKNSVVEAVRAKPAGKPDFNDEITV